MNSVEKIASNAVEKPVQSTTSTKISQTWLASQTGPDRPVDQLARAPAALAAAGDAGSRSRRRSRRRRTRRRASRPTSSTTATASALLIARPPAERRRRTRPARRARRSSALVGLAPAPRHRPQRDHERRAQQRVEQRARAMNVTQTPLGLRDRVLGAHHVVDDPRLAADLGDDPAALERDDRRHARDGDRAQEPLRLRDVALAPPDERRARAPSAISAVQMPTIVSNAQCSIVFAGGRSSGGTESSPVTCVSVLQPTRNESKPGMPMPPLTPLGGAAAVDVLRDVGRGLLHALHRRRT